MTQLQKLELTDSILSATIAGYSAYLWAYSERFSIFLITFLLFIIIRRQLRQTDIKH